MSVTLLTEIALATPILRRDEPIRRGCRGQSRPDPHLAVGSADRRRGTARSGGDNDRSHPRRKSARTGRKERRGEVDFLVAIIIIRGSL